MKSYKSLMGILLGAVLLFGSAFANSPLYNHGTSVNGYALKGEASTIGIRSLGIQVNDNQNRDCSDCEFDFTAYGSECCDSAWDEFGIDCMTLEANYS